MADGGVDIDLYADDIESDFNRQVSKTFPKFYLISNSAVEMNSGTFFTCYQ